MKARPLATSLHSRRIPPISSVSPANSDQDLIVSPNETEVTLTAAEVSDLKRLEKEIENGLHTRLKAKLEIGRALLEIREKKLYRRHKGVIEYAIERFGVSRSEVSNWMGFAETELVMMGAGLQGTLTNDAQYRPLLSLLNRQNRKEGEGLGEAATETIVKIVKSVADEAKEKKVPVTAKIVAKAVTDCTPSTDSGDAKGKAKQANGNDAEEPRVVALLPSVPGFEYTASVYFHGTVAQADALQAALAGVERISGDGTFDLICGTNDRHAFLMTVDAWLAANQDVQRVEIYLHRKHGVAQGDSGEVVSAEQPGGDLSADSDVAA